MSDWLYLQSEGNRRQTAGFPQICFWPNALLLCYTNFNNLLEESTYHETQTPFPG